MGQCQDSKALAPEIPDMRAPSTTLQRPLNRILGRLPEEDFDRLRLHVTDVPVHRGQIFHRRGETVTDVYFPNGGVASVTIATRDGHSVEAATVGHEGLIGIGAVFGSHRATGDTMMQVPDTSAAMMSADGLRTEMQRGGALAAAVNRYIQGYMGLVTQSLACMAVHSTQERCCRWLLMTQDRVQRPQFDLSHEFLAMMLGASRPTVTLVAQTLQAAGLISYTYGRMTVTDRVGLEAASCECYATIRDVFAELDL